MALADRTDDLLQTRHAPADAGDWRPYEFDHRQCVASLRSRQSGAWSCTSRPGAATGLPVDVLLGAGHVVVRSGTRRSGRS